MNSTSMNCALETGNTAQPRLLVSEPPVHPCSGAPSPETASPEHGYELRDHADKIVSWHACVLDACDAIRAHRGVAKVVRCSDRALIRARFPKRMMPP